MHDARLDRDTIRQQWSRRGFNCDLWIGMPGQVWTDFVHDVDEMVLLLEGLIVLEMGGRRLQLAAGEEVLIPAQVRHTFRNLGTTAARWLHGYRREMADDADA